LIFLCFIRPFFCGKRAFSLALTTNQEDVLITSPEDCPSRC
jgi:hypothetical protein